ncbi:MAG: chromosomal replication initiator protein DnaA [Candidatus Saccharibacteria bacterium]|nr:chromosomal replication initiator protein DnaA [Candidatus Saccharibacteria bacterium]
MYDVWKNVLAEIEQKISSENFATWFSGTSLISAEGGEIKVGVRNSFFVKQLRNRYFKDIKSALENNGIEVKTIDFEVAMTNKPKVKPREVTFADTAFQETLKKKREQIKEVSGHDNGLNNKYTLSNFVVGSNNDLAVSAARNIISAPGTSYNPFFLYGGPGLGKTHLIQAIGNEILKNNPKAKVLYIPISHFYSDFVDAVQSGKGKEFHKKFQKLDVLIVDDIQLIVGKEKSQEEFFTIFNDLYQLNKQIIIASDRLPNQIKTMDERLASRLTWGGAFDLQLPKFEDKCAILKSKAEFDGIDIEDEAIEYIAENINTNIRDLESELAKIHLTADVRGVTPLELIKSGAVSVQKTSKMHTISARNIVDKVAKYYQLSVKEMCGKSRVSNIKTARQVAMFLLSKELGMSTTKIADEVGVKDHTTVMHGVKKIDSDLKFNFVLRDQIEEIKERVYG